MNQEVLNLDIAITDALDDPFFIKDSQHRWIFLNRSALSLMNGTREDLLGKTDYDIFDSAQARVFHERDSFVLKSGLRDINEEIITWKGKRHYISTKKSRYTHPDSKEAYIVGTIRDITKRKILEELQTGPGVRALKQYDDFCLGLTEYKPVRYGTQFEIRYRNRMAVDLTGTMGSFLKTGGTLISTLRSVSETGFSQIVSSINPDVTMVFFKVGTQRLFSLIYRTDEPVLSENYRAGKREEGTNRKEGALKNGLEDGDFKKLNKIMYEKALYRDENLNLQTLSEISGIKRNTLSGLIHHNTDKNFYEYVNSFRIAEVKSRLDPCSPCHRKEATILDLAFEAGFRAKSTFNKVFLRETGLTPREYKKRVQGDFYSGRGV